MLAGATAAHPAPAKPKAGSTALPIGRYRDFALSRDLSSLSPKSPANAKLIKQGILRPVQVLGRGDGWAQVRAASVGTTLKMPLGWHGLDGREGAQIGTFRFGATRPD